MSGRRAKPEEKASAVAMYVDGVFITEIAQRTGFGTTTIFRWVQHAGVLKSFSERLTAGSTTRQFGRECIGKKGAFQTTKGGLWIHTDSTYEYARLEQLDRDPSVDKISRCSDRIPYDFGGHKRSYIPDFRVEYIDGSSVVEEVKPARWVTDPKVRAKVDAANAFYASDGVVFRVVTEAEIGSENIKSVSDIVNARTSPEHQAEYKDRRRKQKAVAQRAYEKRRRTIATPEKMRDIRAKAAAFSRKYRDPGYKKAGAGNTAG